MACDNRVQPDNYRELAFAARLAAQLAVPPLKDVTLQSVICNFMWNLTEQNLEAIQAALSYPFSRQQIYQMLTSIVTSAATTTTDLIPKLSTIVGMTPSAVVNSNRPSTSSSTEDNHQDTSERPVILKMEQLPYVYPLESLFGITVDGLLSSADCDFSDSLGKDNSRSSELAGIVLEEVLHRVNVVMHNSVLKINAASSPCFVYFRPNDSCTDIGELLISGVIRKLSVLHCHISRAVATTAIGTVLAAIEGKLPCALSPSHWVEVTSNVIDYIVEDVISAWSNNPTAASRTWETGPVPVLRPTFESSEGGMSLILLESNHPAGSDKPKTTLFDSLMTALYMSKCSGHFSSQDNSYAASERLHQRLADLMNCVLRCKTSVSKEVRMAAIDFLHYFVEELVQRLFVSSAFPCPATLPENTPVMPFIIKEEDFGLKVVDHLTELLVSQAFDLLAKRFPSSESVKTERKSHDVSIQEDLPELTFREKLKMMKSNVLKKLKNPFRSKKDSQNKDDDEETTEESADGNTTAPEPKKKKSFSGFTLKNPFRSKKDSQNKDDDEETTEESADGNTTAPEPKKKKSFSGFTVYLT
ncbi:uncharacterized protein [Sinocyclocheilus grahami]|uniref:uncharacterized protein n=1 Tax=Sinocyclocheilus grahami TaxID=75366 RepID=UPI0007ACE4FB|nr:PREDICTED: uncharacterized protein LOC107576241 [Sinocyclocheilus grahami]